MSRIRQILFKSIPIFLCFIGIGAYGQKESKTFKETFNVNVDAVINIKTTHTDIEFETWDKNEVVVEATIVLEGATQEEAEAYFKNHPVKIMGNSTNIEVSTGRENTWLLSESFDDMRDFDIEIPNVEHILMNIPQLSEFPEVVELTEMIELTELVALAELAPMPIMPPMEFADFDYKAFKKDGDKYLKKWKKEFDKSFDKDYVKKMEEWSKKMSVKRDEMELRREEVRAVREVNREVHRKEMDERREEMDERREEMDQRREEMQQQRVALQAERAEQREAMRETQSELRRLVLSSSDSDDESNIFYLSSDGKKKNYKIKKTIKIKMPKSVKLKMNVRHGEVKLAENTKNINATLSYARLYGATVDGDNSIIKASYSPVSIQKWNHGQLKANYSENISLKVVNKLKMNATSSNVTIGELLHTAEIKNKMGSLVINNVSNNFKKINISVEHGEIEFTLPSTPYVIVVTESGSDITAPATLKLNKTKNDNNTIHKGFHVNKNSNKAIVINSKYSNLVLRK
ncbi:MAG: hypothetical protein COA50_02170 [Flavobacteriaceae bacterium]|nr:MAG: hypothetical protein COA50_02170 [Flavobacteriaceae bacterium]